MATRYGCRVQGATSVALTNLDVLGYLDRVQICTHYRLPGGESDRVPVSALIEDENLVFETLEGWQTDV